MDGVGHARQPRSVALTAHPLRHLSTALAISLAVAVALESVKGGYAAPVPTSETAANSGSDQPDLKAMETQAEKLRSEGKYAAAADIWRQLCTFYQRSLSPKHPNVATCLSNLAGILSQQGEEVEAESLLRQSLTIYEKALGAAHPFVATSLFNLALTLNNQKQYTKARPLLERALVIQEKNFGPGHADIASTLTMLAGTYFIHGQNSEAIPLLQRALAIQEDAPSQDLAEINSAVNMLGVAWIGEGRFSEAKQLYQRSLDYLERIIGPNHANVADRIDGLAQILELQGQVAEAEHLLRRSLNIREKLLVDDHIHVASSIAELASNAVEQGQYLEAESLLKRSLAIQEKVLGLDHPDVASSLTILASALEGQGRFVEAATLLQRSLLILEKNLGSDHPIIAVSLGSLAGILTHQGQYRKAEELYQRSWEMLRNWQKRKPSAVVFVLSATALNNAALMLFKNANYATAERVLREALSIHEKVLGPDHPRVGSNLANLGEALRLQGKYNEAESIMMRALSISQKFLDNKGIFVNLNNLATLAADRHDFARAESLFVKALLYSEKAFGLNHLDVASRHSNLAHNYLDQSEYKKSISHLSLANQVEAKWLYRELPWLPSQQRSRQVNELGTSWMIAFQLAGFAQIASALALDIRLNRQGLLAEIEKRQALLLNAPGIDRDKVEQIQALTQQLASVSLPPDRRAAVRDQRDRLQAELYRQNPDLQIETVTPAAVAKALPADGVLVEFQRYRAFDGRKPKDERWGKPQYIALVLKPNGSISAVPLGPAAVIDATVHKGLGSSADGLSDADAIWGQLSQQVLQPLLPHLSGSRQWFLSPDGELNRVPFAALPAPQQPTMPLAQAVQLRLLTTGRELLRLQQPARAGSSAVVMANPSYDRPGRKTVTAARPAAGSTVSQRRSGDLGSTRWLPLPATEQEGRQVATLLGARLVGGPAATTTALQRQQGPRVLHVATHGFFIADQEAPPVDPLRMVQEQAHQLRALRGEDPQLRSGLVLAGANQPDLDPNDDGYLTAAEAVSLKLKGTELVVLSACSTSQGEVRTGEGVYGLQRSLTVAGARSTLLSLWKVDDAATAEFMVRFYKRLKAGEGRADALAAVQAEFRSSSVRGPKGEDWSTPYHWAAWQLVGDWRPIQGL